jgi:hypothetical protein
VAFCGDAATAVGCAASVLAAAALSTRGNCSGNSSCLPLRSVALGEMSLSSASLAVVRP